MVFGRSIKKTFEFPTDIQVGNILYTIKVDLIDKKNSSVNVRDNLLNFRLSSKMSSNKIYEHFDELLKKIVLKLEKYPVSKVLNFNEVLNRGYFDFASEKFVLEYTKDRGVKFVDNIFYINYRINLVLVEKYVVKYLIQKYLSRMKEYVFYVNSNTYNFDIGNFSLKLVNSKWGHCSSKNDIMLNLKLLNAPIEVLDYVIIHELAHIKVKNHSSRFWLEVERFCPNYKELRKKLKDNSPVLYI